MADFQRCTRCIMDNRSDPFIRFDENGRCNYCTEALRLEKNWYYPNAEGAAKVKEMVKEIKRQGKDHQYDCLMGVSGGLDSSYLAYLASYVWGLRVVGVHIDDGYDTEISQKNIEKLTQKANIKLITIKPDEEQYNALVKAYMKAGVPNLAAPQDNILFAVLYRFAHENHLKYFLSGSNFALECILQKGNSCSPYDLKNLKDIHREFGEKPIDKLQFTSSLRKAIDKHILGWKTLCPLDYIDYNRDMAFQELNDFCGFEYYGRKHLENYLTAFIQLYWFPKRFNIDKRTSHLSSMIVSGQMTRERALAELSEPLYDEEYMRKVKELLCHNMNMSLDELEGYVNGPKRQHENFKQEKLEPLLKKIYMQVKYH